MLPGARRERGTATAFELVSSVTLAAALPVILWAAGATGGPAFVTKPCAAPLAQARVTCGTVEVLENRSSAGGRSIPLNVVIVRAAQPARGAIPLFHLEGGPGLPATPAASFYLGPGAAYAASRDVVLIDQRGTGGSAALECAGANRRHVWDQEYDAQAVEACRRTLEQHADLTQYSTENAAADVDAVRRALGHERIDIAALSYGTELAQAYIKAFRSHVHAAVLAGFVPLDLRQPLFHAMNAQRVFDLLMFECARDVDCRHRYPRLREDWAAVLHRFDAGPVRTTAKGAPIELRRGPFGELVRNILGTAASQRTLPSLVHAAAGGDFTGFVVGDAGQAAPVADGLYLSVVCSEAQPRIPADVTPFTSGTFLGSYRIDQERAACAHWTSHPVASEFYAPPRGGVPVLVISGSMDHVAAPEWGWEFCRTTRGCSFVAIPGLGHGPFDLDRWKGGDCFDRMALEFFADPTHTDSSCVARMRPPPFQ